MEVHRLGAPPDRQRPHPILEQAPAQAVRLVALLVHHLVLPDELGLADLLEPPAGGRLAAGADLVQLWTGLIYRGPGLIGEAALAAGTMGSV